MDKFLYYFFNGPFILLGAVVNFLVWEIFSNGRWKERRTRPNPAIPLQNEAIEARRQLRDQKYQSRRRIEELENKIHDLQKNKKR